MEVADVLPKDAIRSIDSPEFGPDYFGDSGDEVVAAGGLYAFEDPGFPLTVAAGDGTGEVTDGVELGEDAADVREAVLRGDGTTWNPATSESADGRSLVRVPARRLFAFAWQDAHGPGAFYEQAGGDTPT